MLEQYTTTENIRLKANEDLLKVLNALHCVVQEQNYSYREFWGNDPEDIIGVLNAKVTFWLDRFRRNSAVGHAANDQLDAANLPQYHQRAIVAMPNGYAFNGTEFTYTEQSNDNEI